MTTKAATTVLGHLRRAAKQMRDMTIVITLLTVVNVIAVMIAVLK